MDLTSVILNNPRGALWLVSLFWIIIAVLILGIPIFFIGRFSGKKLVLKTITQNEREKVDLRRENTELKKDKAELLVENDELKTKIKAGRMALA